MSEWSGMQIIVGAASVQVPVNGRGRPVIQNLGPGNVYLDSDGDVDTTSGIKLVPDASYEFAGPISDEVGGVWLVADAEGTDVRVVVMGV